MATPDTASIPYTGFRKMAGKVLTGKTPGSFLAGKIVTIQLASRLHSNLTLVLIEVIEL
jgi:hypothetical protein